MVTSIDTTLQWVHATWQSKRHTWIESPITRGWPLMDPVHGAAVVFGYLIMVLILTRIMSWRGKPFNLKPIVILHNCSMTALSLAMCIETIRQALLARYTLFGNGIDTTPAGYGVSHTLMYNVMITLSFLNLIARRWRVSSTSSSYRKCWNSTTRSSWRCVIDSDRYAIENHEIAANRFLKTTRIRYRSCTFTITRRSIASGG